MLLLQECCSAAHVGVVTDPTADGVVVTLQSSFPGEHARTPPCLRGITLVTQPSYIGIEWGNGTRLPAIRGWQVRLFYMQQGCFYSYI